MNRIPAAAEVLIDNERVRVTRWGLPPNGGETGWHRHELDYVITPVTGGVLTIENPGGETVESPLTPGAAYFRRAGVEHNVANRTDAEIVFVETELK